MGTLRLVVAFGAGLTAIVFLILWIVPLATGRIEVSATAVSIDAVEADGFPGAAYLEVTDGYVILSEASIRKQGSGNAKSRSFRLTAPVISESQWKAWQTSLERGEPIDASRLRLVASFEADQIARLWPEVKDRIEAGQPLDLPAVRMRMVGETEQAQYLLSRPMTSDVKQTTLDWEKVRWLRFERHFHSLGRNLRNLGIGLGLIALSIGAFWLHRQLPDDVSQVTLDLTPLFTDDD